MITIKDTQQNLTSYTPQQLKNTQETDNKLFQQRQRGISFDARVDPHNCGVLLVGGIHITAKTPAVINRAFDEVVALLQEANDERSCIIGTISEGQKKTFGTVLEKSGFKIEFLFNNSNSGNDCYLIKKEI